MNSTIKNMYYKSHRHTMLIGINLLLSILGLASLWINIQVRWFILFFVLTLFQLLIHISALYKIERTWITFPIFFMICSYIFNFGHLPLKAFQIEFGKNVLDPLWYIDFSVYQKAAIFVYLSQMMLFFGMYTVIYRMEGSTDMSKSAFAGKDRISKWLGNVTLDEIKKIGFGCLCISILPMAYIDFSKLRLFQQGGYLNTFQLTVPDVVRSMASLFNFAIFALIIAYSKEKKKATVVLIGAMIYKIFMMSYGGRGETVVFFLGLFIVWGNIVHKFTRKQIFFLVGIGYMGIVLLNVIASTRNHTAIDVTEGSIALTSVFFNKQLVSALSEFGSTFATTCFMIYSNPKPALGLNYILPIAFLLPNIGAFNAEIVDEVMFTKHIENFGQPIGGSYIAELYYAFRGFGWIFAFVLGILIGYIAYKLCQAKMNQQYFLYLLFSYTIPLLLWWIRSYFGAIYRDLIWHSAIAVLLLGGFRIIRKRFPGRR